ncbi:MAG: hypothetical protein U9R64_10275 [Pseudomonadota bacterium]|nr:hypothetical protein [Pseudomonadota bacterium]
MSSMGYRWKPGDKAVCVDVAPSREGYAPPELIEGEIYTVWQVGLDPHGSVGLFLDELESRGFAGGYLASRFRPMKSISGPDVPAELIEASA